MTTPLAGDHLFLRVSQRRMLWLSPPGLISLVAELLSGLVDTAFVARLGAGTLAALGVGTMPLSRIFRVFNFLNIGTQTEVAQAMGGADEQPGVRRKTGFRRPAERLRIVRRRLALPLNADPTNRIGRTG
jgi:Na+-driven multidrug efflux pump